MADTSTSINGHELNHSSLHPLNHQIPRLVSTVMSSITHSLNHHNPLHSVVTRLRPPPVEYVGHSKHACFTDTVTGTRHSVGFIATPSTTDFAVRFAAAPDDIHEFRWCSWLPRNGRHHVLMFLHFPSIISQLCICRVRHVRCLP